MTHGALTHHFGSKEELVVAAIGRPFRRCTAGLYSMAETIRRSGGSTDEIVNHLWQMIDDWLFPVTMEYSPKARHNAPFRDWVMVIVQKFHEGPDSVRAELAEQSGLDVDRARILMNATSCMFRGIVARTTVKDDPADFRTMLGYRKDQLRRKFHVRPGDAALWASVSPGMGAS